MKPAPIAMPSHAARCDCASAPAPIRLPTRTAVPCAMPSGTMKVIEARFITEPCAATASAPSRPAM